MSDVQAEEITPDGSIAPVFLDSTPIAPITEEVPDIESQMAAVQAARESAAAKLRALGLTADEVAAVLALPIT